MVVGLGTDIIEIARVRRSLERYGDQFRRRIFTSGEIAYCEARKRGAAESYAARFAAKEAGAKALGTGISRGISWQEIEVRRLPGCAPTLHFSGRAGQRAAQLGATRASLALTHGREAALAVVVLENQGIGIRE
jgi:holo-[acyl-carrier protein] synthase